MEAVLVRQRGAVNFGSYYESLCALENVCPIHQIRTTSKDGIIDCNCDRLRRADWHPLTTALKVNKSLREIKLKVKWKHLYANYELDFKVSKPKSCSINEKDVRYELMKALRSCLAVTTSLKILHLEGICLTKAEVLCLSKGLMKNKTLTTIALCGSSLGNEGARIVCQSLKNSLHIEWVDFTACNLSFDGASTVAAMIKHQGMLRYSDAWKDSLRQCKPNFGAMSGLRRVTLNLNKNIGDKGVKILADSLRDDLWLNAVDLQSCGVTSEGARHLISALKWNSTISVVDLRANELIDDDVLDELYECLQATNPEGASKIHQCEWLPVEVEEIKSKFKSYASAPEKRYKPSKKQQPRASFSFLVTPNGYIKKGRGLPWRTATRKAQRWKVLSSGRKDGPCKPQSNVTATPEISDSGQKDYEVELEAYKRMYVEQSHRMSRMESRVVDLELENRQLKAEVIELRKKLDYQEERGVGDADTLDEIESSLQQFHAFLDLLKSKGLEDVCTLVGRTGISQPKCS